MLPGFCQCNHVSQYYIQVTGNLAIGSFVCLNVLIASQVPSILVTSTLRYLYSYFEAFVFYLIMSLEISIL